MGVEKETASYEAAAGQQKPAGLSLPSLGKRSPAADGLQERPPAYLSVAQKGKLILPTALWILLVIAGVCFLTLLATLNRSLSTLDEVVEIERDLAAWEKSHAREKTPLHADRHHRHEHKLRPHKHSKQPEDDQAPAAPEEAELKFSDDDLMPANLFGGFLPQMFALPDSFSLERPMPRPPFSLSDDRLPNPSLVEALQALHESPDSPLVSAKVGRININLNSPVEPSSGEQENEREQQKSAEVKEAAKSLEKSIDSLMDKIFSERQRSPAQQDMLKGPSLAQLIQPGDDILLPLPPLPPQAHSHRHPHLHPTQMLVIEEQEPSRLLAPSGEVTRHGVSNTRRPSFGQSPYEIMLAGPASGGISIAELANPINEPMEHSRPHHANQSPAGLEPPPGGWDALASELASSLMQSLTADSLGPAGPQTPPQRPHQNSMSMAHLPPLRSNGEPIVLVNGKPAAPEELERVMSMLGEPSQESLDKIHGQSPAAQAAQIFDFFYGSSPDSKLVVDESSRGEKSEPAEESDASGQGVEVMNGVTSVAPASTSADQNVAIGNLMNEIFPLPQMSGQSAPIRTDGGGASSGSSSGSFSSSTTPTPSLSSSAPKELVNELKVLDLPEGLENPGGIEYEIKSKSDEGQ